MSIKEAFAKIKNSENHWVCIYLSKEIHLPESKIEETDFLTGIVVEVNDDYLLFENYDCIIDHLNGVNPVAMININFAHILGWEADLYGSEDYSKLSETEV